MPAPPPPSDPPSAPDLAHERDHLAASRTALSRMRDRTARLDTAAAGDAVSQQFLESALLRRMRALADDPTVPLFFGRLDFDAAHEDARGERFYVGRRHVSDEAGDPMVVDWRARISRAFYRASRAEPMGVALRRRFGFQHGRDDGLRGRGAAGRRAGRAAFSEILEAEIERPRVGPMRDIVATIQPEQDLIVRADLEQSVCVQGAPGTGKTAVGLHRAAYLLYAHRDQLSRQGVLVVGPNASFLRYIGDVLPALGEIDAQQTTIEGLVGGVADPAQREVRRARVRPRRRRHAQGRRPDRGRAAPGPLVLRRRTRRGARRAPRRATLAPRAVRGRGGGGRAARAAESATAPPAACSRSGSRTGSWSRWRSPATHPTTACRTRWRAAARCGTYVDQVWPAVDPARLVLRLLADATVPRDRGRRPAHRRRAGAAAVGQAVQGAHVGAGGRPPTPC